MVSEQTTAQYAEMAAKMLETTPDHLPLGLLRRICHVHELYTRHTAHLDLDVRALLVAMTVEQCGIIPWED